MAVSGVVLLGIGCLAIQEGAQDSDRECVACHGSAERGGSPQQQASPPFDVLGATDPSSPGVGAHMVHIKSSESHGLVPCKECHEVPRTVFSPGHIDTGLPAEVIVGALGSLGDRLPNYDETTHTCTESYCHGDAEPVWTEPRDDACGTCHEEPPPAPHPEEEACDECHGNVVGPDELFVAPRLHVNGELDFSIDCDHCHGSGDNLAPPPDLLGNTDVSFIGVGAHQIHVTGGQFSRRWIVPPAT
jgi:predicted CxxxxCH...CXXCH cytochrome family protein